MEILLLKSRNLKKNYVVIYPNPATNQIEITGLTFNNYLYVLNMIGCVVLKARVTDKNIQLDVSKLNSGFYYIKTDNGDLTKFIKLETPN